MIMFISIVYFSLLLARLHVVYRWARLVTVAGVCRRLSRSVSFHGGPAGGLTRAGQVMTSRRLQSNYSFMAARRASSVTFRC